MELTKYNLNEHLGELKRRIVISALVFLGFFAISYIYSDHIFKLLTLPLEYSGVKEQKIIFTGLAEPFFTYMNLAFFSAFSISWPIFCLQIYRFLAPALYNHEKKIALIIFLLSPILYYSGAFLSFWFIMPKAFSFFMSFEMHEDFISLVSLPKMSEYAKLSLQLIFAFGLAFQMPLILLLLTSFGLIDTSFLIKQRRFAVVIIFILGGILTPPDVVSQIGLAIPMLLLYEVSIVICKLTTEQQGKKNVRCKMDS